MPPHMNLVERRASRKPARQYVSESHDHKPDAPYKTRDMAAICGVTLDCFYKRRATYEKINGLPAPYKPGCWDRASVDAWRRRNHPDAPKAKPANDIAPTILPGNDSDWNAYLHQHYAKEGV